MALSRTHVVRALTTLSSLRTDRIVVERQRVSYQPPKSMSDRLLRDAAEYARSGGAENDGWRARLVRARRGSMTKARSAKEAGRNKVGTHMSRSRPKEGHLHELVLGVPVERPPLGGSLRGRPSCGV